jgi:hypothetical protein
LIKTPVLKLCLLTAEQEITMSIAGISAISTAAYLQQSQSTAQTNAATRTVPDLTAAATQSATVQQATPSQPSGQVRHHHHQHGGGSAAAQSADITQSGTTDATSILNTLV